jgi:hypothetical protein
MRAILGCTISRCATASIPARFLPEQAAELIRQRGRHLVSAALAEEHAGAD